MRRLGDTGTLSSAETTIASAATTDLGTSKNRNVAISGATTITSFGTTPNRETLIRFTAALTLTYNATSLILPGAASIVTAAGDTCLATSDASGNWRVREYQRAAGPPTVVPAGAYTPYTPTVAAAAGTITTVGSVSGRWQQTGKRVDFEVQVTITTNGNGSAFGLISLPTAINSSLSCYCVGRSSAGPLIFGEMAAGDNRIFVFKPDGTYPFADGVTVKISGSYEAA